jgi:hypothetical protein
LQTQFIKRFALILCAVCASSTQGALVFNFTPAIGASQSSYNQILPAFQTAAGLWSGVLTDDIQVNLALNFTTLSPSLLTSTQINTAPFTYADFRPALFDDIQSNDDASVYQHLQKDVSDGQAFNLLLNRALLNPGDSSSATPYLDNDGDDNNQTIQMSLANAKAIGFEVDAEVFPTDATITLNDAVSWDANPQDGIDNDKYDQVGIALREIGRALGFVSGVDVLDSNSPPHAGPFGDYQFANVTPMDLLRYSSDSVAQGDGVFDWTADNRTKYLSLDGGATSLAELSTGVNFGDGNPAGNWKAGQNTGVMNPSPAQGQNLDLSIADLRVMDAIGYNVVPEPSAMVMILAAGLFGSVRRPTRRTT